jgi:hypothetical protein
MYIEMYIISMHAVVTQYLIQLVSGLSKELPVGIESWTACVGSSMQQALLGRLHESAPNDIGSQSL